MPAHLRRVAADLRRGRLRPLARGVRGDPPLQPQPPRQAAPAALSRDGSSRRRGARAAEPVTGRAEAAPAPLSRDGSRPGGARGAEFDVALDSRRQRRTRRPGCGEFDVPLVAPPTRRGCGGAIPTTAGNVARPGPPAGGSTFSAPCADNVAAGGRRPRRRDVLRTMRGQRRAGGRRPRRRDVLRTMRRQRRAGGRGPGRRDVLRTASRARRSARRSPRRTWLPSPFAVLRDVELAAIRSASSTLTSHIVVNVELDATGGARAGLALGDGRGSRRVTGGARWRATGGARAEGPWRAGCRVRARPAASGPPLRPPGGRPSPRALA